MAFVNKLEKKLRIWAEQHHDHTQKPSKEKKMVQPCSKDQEKMKYRNLYKNTRQSTIRI
jgi:hypothetical protein